MNEERQSERDSQLSAMFDGELPGAECELLARRLTRDEALRAQWSRFSMIGAALRAERGVALHDRVAWRVQSVVAQEATYGDGTVDTAATSTHRGHRSRQLNSRRLPPPLVAFRATGRRRQHCRRRRRHVDLLACAPRTIRRRCSPATPVTESIVLAARHHQCRRGAQHRSGRRTRAFEWRARSLRHAGAEFFRQHRAAGAARELRGGAQRIFRSAVAPHGAARAGGHRPVEVRHILDEEYRTDAAAGAADAP